MRQSSIFSSEIKYVDVFFPITVYGNEMYQLVRLVIALLMIYEQAILWAVDTKELGGFVFTYRYLSKAKKELFLEAMSDIDLVIYGDNQGDIVVGLTIK